MNNRKVMAVVIVVVAVVLVAVAYFMINHGEDDGYRSSNTEGRLLIMGNANNDDYLDQADITSLENIISSESDWKTENPLADANNDGVVNQADIDMVQRMISREAMDINYAYISGDSLVVRSIAYPVKNIVAVGDNVVLSLKTIGAEDRIVGIALSDSEDPIYSDVAGLPSVRGSSTTVPSISLISNVADKDTVVVTSTSSRYVTNEAEILQSQIPVVRFNVDGGESGMESIAGILTIGYLLGMEDEAAEYVRFCDDILTEVASRTDFIIDKATFIATNRTTNVSGVYSEYYRIPILAGGTNVISSDETYTSWSPGMDWLYGYDFEYIVHSTSLGYGEQNEADVYATYSANFSTLQAYAEGNFVVVNANVPAPIRVAYIAEIFYPEVFDEGYGDSLHQEFINRFIKNLSGTYDVTSDGSFVITQS